MTEKISASYKFCWAIATSLVVAFCAIAANAKDQAQMRATGLLPPTHEDLRWMDGHMVKTKAVKLNRLGLERVNEYRRQQGLAPLDVAIAPDGEEVIPEAAANRLENITGALPLEVDNSTLPSFPPVRDQGQIGSSACFSSGYYAATHMLGLVRGFNNKNDQDNSTKLSPKWLYPMVNGGQDKGSGFANVFNVMLQHGIATWAEWPYSGANVPSSYLEWCRDAGTWRRAINFRMAQTGSVPDLDTDAGLNNLKTLLCNGSVLLFGTDIFGWKFFHISDDPAIPEDNMWVGKSIGGYVNNIPGGHAMTCVGYNDDIWCDLNKNGVVDPGEKGALRICNSWGTGWQDAGFTWLAYDALRTMSAVAGARTPGRVPAWWDRTAYWITARPAYMPKLLGEFTLTHRYRNQLDLDLGRSSTSATRPTTIWQPGALVTTPTQMFGQGGPFGFDGGITPTAGTFVFDFSDIVVPGLNRYYLSVGDTTFTGAATISDFLLTDDSGNIVAQASRGVPGIANGSTALAYADFDSAAPAIVNNGVGTARPQARSGGMTVGGDEPSPPRSSSIRESALASGVTGSKIQTSAATNSGANGLPPLLARNTGTVAFFEPRSQAGTVDTLTPSNPKGTDTGTSNAALASAPVALAATGNVALDPQLLATTPTNDNFIDRIVLSGISLKTSAATPKATAEPGEPAHDGQLAARSVWWSWTPMANGVVTISTHGSTFDTVLAVYTGSGFSTLRTVAANNDADGLVTSRVTFPALVGVTYQIAVDGSAGASGIATLSIEPQIGPPANDNFASASILNGSNPAAFGANYDATFEAGEPHHAGIAGNRSVWWVWTAPTNGLMTFTTEGSTFNTVLAIYKGTSVNALTYVASNNDRENQRTSEVAFWATAGVTYRIAVDGVSSTPGIIALTGFLESAGDRLYATDFRSFYLGADTLVGTDGWYGLNSSGGVQGLMNAVLGWGPGAYVGYNSPANAPVQVYRYVDFQPIAQGRPMVTFSVALNMIGSSNGQHDWFGFSIYNRAQQFLARLLFDNLNSHLYRHTGIGSDIDTAVTFQKGVSYWLTFTINFSANTWSATLGNVPVFNNQPFHTGGLTRDLSEVVLEWYPRNVLVPGNNYLLFDNLTLSAEAAMAMPVITSQPQSRTNVSGSAASFHVQANGAAPLNFQWQFNGSNLVNETNATLTLLNVTTDDAGAYRAVVSNPVGSTYSQNATLTVTNVIIALRLSQPIFAEHGFDFRLTAAPNHFYEVETSTNLTQWTPLGSMATDPNGNGSFLDASAPSRPSTFYRVKLLQ